jgi:hypothetical protein
MVVLSARSEAGKTGRGKSSGAQRTSGEALQSRVGELLPDLPITILVWLDPCGIAARLAHQASGRAPIDRDIGAVNKCTSV